MPRLFSFIHPLKIEISKLLTHFWVLVSIGINAKEDRAIRRDELGTKSGDISKKGKRYLVALPWKESVVLSDNYTTANKHLHSLMKKLNRFPELLER